MNVINRHLIAEISYKKNYIKCVCDWEGEALPETNFRGHVLDNRGIPLEVMADLSVYAPGYFAPAKNIGSTKDGEIDEFINARF